MNRLFLLVAVCGVFLAAVAVSSTVQAQSALSDAHIERIKQNCVTARSALDMLHVRDAGLRNHRGKLYEQVSTRLMAPLNSRITYDRLNGLELAATTLEYDNQLKIFRDSYIKYDESISKTAKIDCTSKPVEFYDSVKQTRELRQQLHSSTVALADLAKKYKVSFEEFAQESGGGE